MQEVALFRWMPRCKVILQKVIQCRRQRNERNIGVCVVYVSVIYCAESDCIEFFLLWECCRGIMHRR